MNIFHKFIERPENSIFVSAGSLQGRIKLELHYQVPNPEGVMFGSALRSGILHRGAAGEIFHNTPFLVLLNIFKETIDQFVRIRSHPHSTVHRMAGTFQTLLSISPSPRLPGIQLKNL